jgi:hypothetical protein
VGNSCGLGLKGKGVCLSYKTILEGNDSQDLGSFEGLHTLNGLSVVEESLCNFIPSYMEVLT